MYDDIYISKDIPTKEAFSIPNIGDKVYLIYIGYVRVNSVDKDGTITFNIGEKEHSASRAQYRPMDRMDAVIKRYKDIRDYTEVITNE